MASVPTGRADVEELLKTHPYVVELDIYSGRTNPIVGVKEEMAHFTDHHQFPSTGLGSSLGYRGFIVHKRTPASGSGGPLMASQGETPVGSHPMTIGIGSNVDLEKSLLQKFPDFKEHVTKSLETEPKGVVKALMKEPVKAVGEKLYPLPDYDPSSWNNDPYIQKHNNCYNYATNKVTNTFAQPGRASGRPEPSTADQTLQGCLADGYIRRGDGNPPSQSENTGAVALVIWPGNYGEIHDFHFYRLDSNHYWSHKPGQTKVRNYDEDGKPITDPQYAARGPYTEWVGYIGNNSKVNIK